MRDTSNRPIIDTGWRVGMPVQLNSGALRMTKTIVVTCLDGVNREITLHGYGRPEWNTVDR